ncbi:MAG: anthranilate synthase component I [Anaerolineales bacterium]|nr:anthranilate synthase component I [Anaerolineales bacterium]
MTAENIKIEIPEFLKHRIKPIVRRLSADFETPASVYLKLAGDKPSFMLESVSGGEQLARYSFIGVDIEEAFVLNQHNIVHYAGEQQTDYPLADGQDPFDILRAYMRSQVLEPVHGIPRFLGGLVGYLSYDVVNYFEPTVGIKRANELPEAIYLVVKTLIAFDHAFGQIILIANAQINGNEAKALAEAEVVLDDLEKRLTNSVSVPQNGKPNETVESLKSNVEQPVFEKAVLKAKEYIAAGDIFQVVLSQKLSKRTHAAPFNIYRAVRSLNPSPYLFFFNFGKLVGEDGFYIIGASPELHVRMEDETATLRPIAGTRKRGLTEQEDQALEQELLADEKERAEHIMLVDLGRNDLGRVCEYGSVKVEDFMVVERYSHVMHIVSQVVGKINSALDGFDLMKATFPAGTVSGAPKIRAMQIIEELETCSRGPYAGAIGYFSYDGSMDSCIGIRTMTMRGNEVNVQSGGGIVADSVPHKEYEEAMNKARALAEAILIAENGGDK